MQVHRLSDICRAIATLVIVLVSGCPPPPTGSPIDEDSPGRPGELRLHVTGVKEVEGEVVVTLCLRFPPNRQWLVDRGGVGFRHPWLELEILYWDATEKLLPQRSLDQLNLCWDFLIGNINQEIGTIQIRPPLAARSFAVEGGGTTTRRVLLPTSPANHVRIGR
jgi:hypothetical protein